ncbi:MAG: hypothetical protein AAF928_03055 [Myxococcota bacterium]
MSHWVVGVAGVGVVLATSCGGEAIIDGPPGSGGAGATTGSAGEVATTTTSATNGIVAVAASTGPGGGSRCQDLEIAYAEVLDGLKECRSDLDVPQCEQPVPTEFACPCTTFVNIDDASDFEVIAELAEAYETAGCFDNTRPCPAVECPVVEFAECVDDRCVDVFGN